jgi:cell wall-associated NlpC family hydrolase
MTVRRDAILAAARSYLGVRYHHQGRNRAGMDCAGLIVCVARDLGINAGDLTAYARRPDGRTLRNVIEAQAPGTDCYKPGDILLMRFEADPQHLAIVTDHGMIHSYARARMVVEHRMDAVWTARIVAAYQFPGVEQ